MITTIDLSDFVPIGLDRHGCPRYRPSAWLNWSLYERALYDAACSRARDAAIVEGFAAEHDYTAHDIIAAHTEAEQSWQRFEAVTDPRPSARLARMTPRLRSRRRDSRERRPGHRRVTGTRAGPSDPEPAPARLTSAGVAT